MSIDCGFVKCLTTFVYDSIQIRITTFPYLCFVVVIVLYLFHNFHSNYCRKVGHKYLLSVKLTLRNTKNLFLLSHHSTICSSVSSTSIFKLSLFSLLVQIRKFNLLTRLNFLRFLTYLFLTIFLSILNAEAVWAHGHSKHCHESQKRTQKMGISYI